MRNGTVFGKTSGLGGAVGLLFFDKKDKRDKKGKKSKLLELQRERERELQLERDELIREHALREKAIKREMEDMSRAWVDTRRRASVDTRRRASVDTRKREHRTHKRDRESSVSPPSPEPSKVITSPPRKDSLLVAKPAAGPSPAFGSESLIPISPPPTPMSLSPIPMSVSPNPSETVAVPINPSIASFISARRQTLKEAHRGESGSDDSELESVGLSMTSSTLFYGGSRPRKATVTSGVGMPVSTPPTSSSPAPSAYSTRQRRPSRLSQRSGPASDSDDGDYATADDHSQEATGTSRRVENGNDTGLGLTTRTVNSSKQYLTSRGSSYKVEDSAPFATIRERKKERGQLSQLGTPPDVTDFDEERLVGNEGGGGAEDGSKVLHTGSGSGLHTALAYSQDAPEPDHPQAAPIGLGLARVPLSQPEERLQVNHGGSNKPGSPALKGISEPPAVRASLEVPGSEIETERTGTFGYATRDSAGPEGSNINNGRTSTAGTRGPSVACGVSSPFARGVEGNDSPIDLEQEPTLPGSGSPSQLSPVIAPTSSRLPLASSPPSLLVPLVVPSRSPVQAHAVFPPSPDGSEVATTLDVNNNAGNPNHSTWVYHPTSATGRRSLVTLPVLDEQEQPTKKVTSLGDNSDSLTKATPTTPLMSTTTIDTESLVSSYGARYTDSTVNGRAFSTRSTSSLTSSRVTSIRPPSLSAVAGTHSKPRTKPRGPRMSSKTPTPNQSPAAELRSQVERRANISHAVNGNSDTDGSSSGEDEHVLRSPQSRFDFSSPRPGFVPSPSIGSAAWISEDESGSKFGRSGFMYRYGDPREEDEETSKRGSDLVSEPAAPQLSTSSSSYEASELQSPRETPAMDLRRSEDST